MSNVVRPKESASECLVRMFRLQAQVAQPQHGIMHSHTQLQGRWLRQAPSMDLSFIAYVIELWLGLDMLVLDSNHADYSRHSDHRPLLLLGICRNVLWCVWIH